MIRNLINRLFPDQRELIITTKLQPSFPSFKIDQTEINKLVFNHPVIKKVMKSHNCYEQHGSELFNIRYSFKILRDSEYYPDCSPVKIVVSWSRKEIKKYHKNCAMQNISN